MELEKDFYSSPRWSWEILDCAMPMTFDTYGNCAHQCVYCFAFFQRAVGPSADDYLHHRVKAVNVERVKRMFTDPDAHAGTFASYIKRRFVLQWGGLSDGFDWYERKFRKSLELLKFFREIDYPVSISTKGTWFLDDPEYRAVLSGATNTHWKYSIITLDKAQTRILEAGVPTSMERFEALRRLNELGVGATTLRYRPFVIGASDAHIEEMTRLAKEAGCYSLTSEFLCLESRTTANHLQRYKIISDAVGFDVWDFYRKNSYSGSGLLRLNYDLKRPYVERLKAASAQYDIPLFISDAHHKEDSTAAGCCGLPATGPLSVYNKGQFAEAILIAKRNGRVAWSEIAKDAAWLKNVSFVGAEGYNHGDTFNRARNKYHSMFDFMRDMWNSPTSWSSPARYFGGALVPSELDANGDIVYLYNKPYVEKGERVQSIIELRAVLSEQREEMGRDGSAWGHVAFPVFIPTRGRWDTIAVTKPLDAARINYTLVVEPQEEDAYRRRFPEAEMLVLAESARGPWFARQSILDYCRDNGLAWCWMLDDNIKGFLCGLKPVSARAAMSYAESFVGQYANLAIVSLDYQQYAFRQTKPYSVNRRAACSMLISTAPGADYRADAEIKEDLDFQLQRLAAGMSTVLVHRFAMDKPAMGRGGKGGCHEYYKEGRQNLATRFIVGVWPGVTNAIAKGTGTDVKVDWRRFPNTLRPIGQPTPAIQEVTGEQ